MKALSTSSEDEAIACLRMARKQNNPYSTLKEQETETTLDKWKKYTEFWLKKFKTEQANVIFLNKEITESKQKVYALKARITLNAVFIFGIICYLTFHYHMFVFFAGYLVLWGFNKFFVPLLIRAIT